MTYPSRFSLVRRIKPSAICNFAHFFSRIWPSVEDIYKPDKTEEAKLVFGTTDDFHPAVHYLFNNTNDFYVGGKVQAINLPAHYDFVDLRRGSSEWISVVSIGC